MDAGANSVIERPIPERLGQYRLLELVGRGGMSVVYRARHIKLKRDVAVKILLRKRLNDAGAVARFAVEMEAIGRIDEHPNIVRARDAGEVDGHHFLVMDYVDGIDASQLVCRLGKLSSADACEIVSQAALGLEHAHRQSVVHRDVKPANLMLNKTG